MYYDNSIGDIVFRLRKARGVTQDYLSDLIDCSPGTISRIENGSQVPTVPMLRRIFEQLGEPGFFSCFYYEKENYKLLELEISLIESYENKRLEAFEKHFDIFTKQHKNDSNYCKRIYKLMKLLYLEWISEGKSISVSEYEKLLKMSDSDDSIDNILEEKLFDYIEILVINNIAISLMKEGNYIRAEVLLEKMIRYLDKSRYLLPRLRKTKAGLYNNLAICENEIGNPNGAFIAIEKAIRLFSLDGGLLFGMKLIRTRFRLLEYYKMTNESNGDYFVLKNWHSQLSSDIKRDNMFRDFLGDSCCLLVF